MRNHTVISLQGLSKYYYSAGTVATGLRKINLELKKGEFVVITGESGSGKSTLLNVISGLLPYEEGELYIDGEPTSHYDADDWERYRRDKIGFVFQSYQLIESYTVGENVESALLLRGHSGKEAKEECAQYLAKVGLSEYRNRKAAKLSSGQKQRLAIARALAKDTDIIVADEPTGNLDPENGREIMRILSGLSKDRLVIVVTHNYEEAAPYATRKLVIHDSELAEDTELGRREESEVKQERVTHRARGRQLTYSFLKRNLTSQPGRVLFLVLFFFFTACASYVFFGSFLSGLDDVTAKEYSSSYFYNNSSFRLAVRHSDGSGITKEDIAYFRELAYVEEVDGYDLVNDVYYFWEEGNDYKKVVTGKEDFNGQIHYSFEIYLDQYTKFVRSVAGMEQEDLAWGRLPENSGEIVIMAQDDSYLGETITCYFNNKRVWQSGSFIRKEMTVCGIVAGEGTQLYVSELFAKALTMGYGQRYSKAGEMLGFFWEMPDADTRGKRETSFILYPDDTLAWNEGELVMFTAQTRADYIDYNVEGAYIFGETIADTTDKVPSEEEDRAAQQGGQADSWVTYEFGTVAAGAHSSSGIMAALPEAVFAELAEPYESTQASLYLEDYAFVDQVIEVLEKSGYETVSPYRASMRVYNAEKVGQRLISLAISLGALIVVLGLGILIGHTLLRLKDKDYLILRSIGMGRKEPGRIVFRETLICAGAAFVLMELAAAIAAGTGVQWFLAIANYYHMPQTIILCAVHMAAAAAAAAGYGRHLQKKLAGGSRSAD